MITKKIRHIILLLIFCTASQSMLLPTAIGAIPDKYEVELKKYAKLTEIVSGGFYSGSRVIIRVGNYTFYKFDRGSPGLAGLYVVAIYNNKVLIKASYNTYSTPGASEGLAQDIDKLPYGTFVVVAGMDEPTRLFDERGQNALYQIGAEKGLLNRKFRTSYLCLGVKGLERGKAIEKVGMEELKHIGSKATEQISFTFPKKNKPGRISRKPGRHEGLMFGDTEVIYYIPRNFNPDTSKYLFGIHGAGDWHRPGALTRIDQFRDIADIENLVIIAPAFDCVFNWPIDRRRDLDKNWKFKNPKIIKDRYLWGFIALLNNFNEHRTDLKLIEIFDFFNKNLMKREKFYLDGHSGGGQFVARFVLFHPELIEKAAICSAGSFVFPNRDKDYPYGLKLDDLEKTFGPQIQADDLKLDNEQIDQKLAQMLDLKIFIIAGERETVNDPTDRAWQGKSSLEKAHNFLKVMKDEDLRLKEKGLRPKSKPYQFELHTIPDVGHNSHETAKKAKELLFPANEKSSKVLANEQYVFPFTEKKETSSNLERSDKSLSEYVSAFEKYTKYTEVVSGGFYDGNKVFIRVGDHVFYDNVPDGPSNAGLYVVAIFENEVLLQYHYNTYSVLGSCKWLMADFQRLPRGTFIVIAAKDEPTNYFNETGQKVLYQIGAGQGLLGQKFRSSYLCIGMKGLAQGKGIEKMGMKQVRYSGSEVGRNIELTLVREPKLTKDFFKIYDTSTKQRGTWSVNDHCFIRGKNGTWHMFGITLTRPQTPISGKVFTHATASNLTQVLWEDNPFALKVDTSSDEVHLWAPYVVYHNGVYYMYYCAGDKDPTKYKINLAVSKDLETWQRHPENPMVVDGFHARDPFVIKVGDEWLMYYTATTKPTGGYYIVACRKSKDLVHWSRRREVFRDFISGTGGGPTESPTIVRRGEYYYLFIGPRNEYAGTDVFRSKSPFLWKYSDRVGHIRAHAAEVIRDVDGKWYVSHCGVDQGGVYLAPLYWSDGLDDTDTSLPIPR